MANSQFLVKPLQMPKRMMDSTFLMYLREHGFFVNVSQYNLAYNMSFRRHNLLFPKEQFHSFDN